MNLNDKIKKHNLLIEELNTDIEQLILSEGLYDVWSFIRNPQFYVAKKTIKKLIKTATDEIEKKQEELKLKSTKKDLEKTTKELKKIQDVLGELQNIKREGLEFNNIWIEFKNKTTIDIESFKPGFKRDLEGTMKFTVVGVDNENRFMELKHESFGGKSIIKLYFNTLDTYVDQQSDISLIYSKYGDPDMKAVKGKEKKVIYKITKKQ